MNDYGLSVLEQYGMTGSETRRTRGALLCRQGQEVFLLRPFTGSEKKLEKEKELLQTIRQQSSCLVDYYLENQEGGLVSADREGNRYTLQRWYEGRECDTKSTDDLLRSMTALAKLHRVMQLPLLENYRSRSLQEEYQRHNQELKKIRKFIRKKHPDSDFEKLYIQSFDFFLEQAEYAASRLLSSPYEELRKEADRTGRICHGNFNYHNLLLLRGETAVTDFSHWNYDLPVTDLYDFLRKIMEKYNWNQNLCSTLVAQYEKIRPLSEGEKQVLAIRFCYPEKYWKVANYYFSHNKVWISEKNTEKLQNLMEQKEVWESFCRNCQKGLLF